MAKAGKPFVNSADTSTQAANSRSEVDRLLRRYGASAITMSENVEEDEIVVIEVVEAFQGQLGTGTQRLLASPATEED